MRLSDVPTPALVVDLDTLDANIATMRADAASLGLAIRPHAKAHKCVEIAQRLNEAGALGSSCATIGEAETMAMGGIGGILVTSPVVSQDALSRLRRLLLRGAKITVVADHPAPAAELVGIAEAAGRTLDVLVDIDVGTGRTGCVGIADAVALARQVDAASHLSFAGIQAYWGHLQQVTPVAERARLIGIQAERVRAVIEALTEAGLKPRIVSGAGTGSYRLDAATGLFTEIQPGSFMFMDSCYGGIEISEGSNPYRPSLFVAATVVTSSRPGRVVVNAGFKAFATDSGKPRAVAGAPAGAEYRFMGDEHGALDFTTGEAPLPGATVLLLTSHCDPTVNLYGAFHVVRGDEVIDVWAIRGRH